MSKQHLVAVIGAGPAGIYGTRKLTEAGHRVLLINRDIKPGGLAEYGIFMDKEKMKTGLRKQFQRILAHPQVSYLGHVTVGEGKALALKDLQEVGFSAVVVAAGAQGTKKLGLPGEDTKRVYHAKDVVYHFNKLPPFAQRPFELGKRVAIIGMGNVMVDVANWLLNYMNIEEVTVVARRGPKEKAYDDSEFEVVEKYLDNEDMREEIERIRPDLENAGQNVEEIIEKFVGTTTPPPNQKLRFRYLCSPTKVIPDNDNKVAALEVELNKLIVENGRTAPKGTGKRVELPLDCVIYAIGDEVDASLGLPFNKGAFVTNPAVFPGDPNPAQYQPYNPETNQVLDGIFVIGWSRNASVGLVGVAKQDAERGIKVVNEYLAAKEGFEPEVIEQKIERVLDKLEENKISFVTKEDIAVLEAKEREEAKARHTWEYKYASDDEMLEIIAAPRAAAS
ncbi:MAG TPA: FAD-dependent oxidoreductase [Candidatus Binatia bacterium]|nr:FAD-dependent oxidoreductase [Candidatus Binatia bacterium]